MSATAEQIQAALALEGPPELSPQAKSIQAALRLGTQTGGSPSGDERTWGERFTQAGAAIAEPIMETVLGVQELRGDYPAMEQRRAATRRGLQRVREEADELPDSGRLAGRITGEVAQLAFPVARGAQIGRAIQRGLQRVRGRRMQAAVPLAGEATAVGTVESLKSPEATGQSRLESGLEGAAWQLAGGLPAAVAKKLALPGLFRRTDLAEDEARALREAGITPRIPISAKGIEGTGPFSSIASWMHRRPLGSVPPTQDVIRAQQDLALSDWRDMIFTRSMPPNANIPLPGTRQGSLKPIRDTFKDIDKAFRNEYKEILDPYTFDVMGQGAVGDAIETAISRVPGQVSQRQVLDKVSDLLQGYVDDAGRLTGPGVSKFKRSLRNAARLAEDGEVKRGFTEVIKAVDDAVEARIRTYNPAHADRYAEIRTPYANFTTIQEAAKGRELGDFMPKDLFKASERKLSQQKRSSARASGEGPLQWEGERAAQVYDFPGKSEESNIFQLGALLGGGAAALSPTLAGGTIGAPLTAAMLAPTALGLSTRGTRYASNELGWQQALQRILEREGVQQTARAIRTAIGQWGDEF